MKNKTAFYHHYIYLWKVWVPHKMLAKKDIVAARLLRITQKIVSLL